MPRGLTRGQVAYGRPAYAILLPRGRETLTEGNYEARLDAIRDFGIRLGQQGPALNKPILTTLGQTVTAWQTAARALRETQETAKTAVETARATLEALRIAPARELYGMVGEGIVLFKATPLMVDSLFDVALLRGPSQAVPAPPADTVWTPAARRLETTALPAGATRLEGWRQAPAAPPSSSSSASRARGKSSSQRNSPSSSARLTNSGSKPAIAKAAACRDRRRLGKPHERRLRRGHPAVREFAEMALGKRRRRSLSHRCHIRRRIITVRNL